MLPYPSTDICVQTYYDEIRNAISQSLKKAREATKATKKQHKILSEHTFKLLTRRKELQGSKIKTRSMKNELSALYKITNKYIKRDYERYRQDTIDKHLQHTGSTKKAFKELRTSKTWIEGLNRQDKTANNRTEIITVASEFYKRLYSDNTRKALTSNNINRSIQGQIRPVDEIEIIEAIKSLKLDKSPGSDNITNEMLKISPTKLAGPLAVLFNTIINKSETPSQWSESNIILIYKKGDPKDIGNYRPISLLPSLYKLFSTIINKRISATLELKQPIGQAGFRKGFSTVDHMHTIGLIIEKYQEQRRPLYIAFIDYQKAFDTVTHSSIWKSLEQQGVEDEYINVIKSIYNNNTGKIKLETLGPSFSIERGVRQGDPLSPKIFIAILETIISEIDWSQSGLYIKGTFLSHLRFADDLVLLSESSTQLQYMIGTLHIASVKVGLEMNLTKTKTMTNSWRRPITINGEPLEYVDQYIYLGKRISFDKNNNELEIERRVQYTWNKYWSLKEIFKSNLPIATKTKVMNSSLLPCLTYGCQTWKFTTKLKHKLITCQRGLERSMLKIRKLDKVRHTKIRSITKATNALSYTQKLKWKWAGHVARLKDERWTKKVTFWKGPLGKRSKGRPLTRWEDEIIRAAGPNWQEKAQDRDKWTFLEEAFTH